MSLSQGRGIVGFGALSDHGANAQRDSLQTLLVGIGCGGMLGLLSGFDAVYQGSLAEARQPFALMRSPFGAEMEAHAEEGAECMK